LVALAAATAMLKIIYLHKMREKIMNNVRKVKRMMMMSRTERMKKE
jgi:hypothetical protein